MYEIIKNLPALVIVVIAGVTAAQETRSPLEQRIAAIETGLTVEGKTFTIAERMAHYGVPGVSIAVVDGYRIDWANAYGLLSRESKAPVTTGSFFEAASTTKMLVATTAMMLVQEGKLDLDADINSYLKSWKVPENELTAERKVTLRLLLSHRAGLPSTNYDYEDAVPTLVQVLKGELPALNQPAVVGTVPGSAWQYSNIGYSVIQLLLEESAGMPLPELMQERLFKPLGMTSSTMAYPLSAKQQQHEALPHDKEGTVHEPAMHLTSLAQGGLMTTPSDLAGFIIAMMQSYQGKSSELQLGQETVKQMLHPELALDPAIFGMPVSQGLGVFLIGEGEGLTFAHPGENMPGATCWVTAIPRAGRGLVVMTNGAQGTRLAMEILAAVTREYRWPE
jgi:CubicO group peptidase (beta-lactamase class C family)